MSSLYFYGKTSKLIPIDDVYGKYPSKQFASPKRSTIPLLSWLKHEESAVQSVLAELDIPKGDLYLEYSVKPKMGKGGASMTDLMVIDKKTKHSVAIEAKWTEPTDKTVGKWFGKSSSSDNKKLVLQSWLELLPAPMNKKHLPEDFRNVIYQTLHRAASACSAGTLPTLAYLCFRDQNVNKKANFKQNLVAFRKKMDISFSDFPIYYIEIDMEPTEAYAQKIKLPKGTTHTMITVYEAMKSSQKLFDFKSPIIQEIK